MRPLEPDMRRMRWKQPTTSATFETDARWLNEDRRVVRALLFDVDGSAPLASGATMLVDSDGAIEGSITGGCVEAAVVAESEAVLAGEPPRVVTYGISDELAGTAGLPCGGTVHVLVHELAGIAAAAELAMLRAVLAGRSAAIATLIDGDRAGAQLALVDGCVVGSLGGSARLDDAVSRDAAALLEQGVTTTRRYGLDGAALDVAVRVLVRSFGPPPRMIIFGAIDFSAALARIAGELGYAVTICDPRERFARAPRFEQVAEVVVAWPDAGLQGRQLGPRDAVLVFTHDPRIDEPALIAALDTDAGYIGALGSRRATAERTRRLRAAGVDECRLARVRGPCGLDIGAATVEEVAISVLAEIIAVRCGRTAAPMCGKALDRA
jgi:xanthine dehydrogenase accessory factor